MLYVYMCGHSEVGMYIEAGFTGMSLYCIEFLL